jgi:hypothetical protein
LWRRGRRADEAPSGRRANIEAASASVSTKNPSKINLRNFRKLKIFVFLNILKIFMGF